jgi:hypothetical protein
MIAKGRSRHNTTRGEYLPKGRTCGKEGKGSQFPFLHWVGSQQEFLTHLSA